MKKNIIKITRHIGFGNKSPPHSYIILFLIKNVGGIMMKNNIDIDRIIKTYLKKGSNKCFRELPVRYEYKLIICKYIMKFIDADKFYTEKEINCLLKDIYYDYATLRRCLVDFSLICRHRDGSLYWVNKPSKV